MAVAGEHARRTVRRLSGRTLVSLIVMIAVGVVTGLKAGLAHPLFVTLELGLIAGMLAINRLLLPYIDRWDRGATGEETVGRLLATLEGSGDWRVIHDVNTGRGNIDHVVVGPGGLFTIETKSHPGRVSVDRIDERWLKQAYAQRKWLERATQHEADALLVFSRAYLDRPIARRRGVLVLPSRMLCEHLRRRQPVLSSERVDAIRTALPAA